ncbi:MAG: NAD(P)/FAD-dependent oxidoreductase [Phycisphaerae bacterium]
MAVPPWVGYDAVIMPILVRNIPLGLDESEEALVPAVARRLSVPVEAIRSYAIVRRSLDARRKDIHFSYHLEVALDEPLQKEQQRLRRLPSASVAWIENAHQMEPSPGNHSMPERPIIIGFGPAGMFAALRLAEHGYNPIVLERGRDVRRRHRDVLQRYFRQREFDPESNVLFGEGGAGTYSDGKVYTRVNDPLCRTVLETLYHHGADPNILVDARPHIGSDKLPTICSRIRRKIESLGGEIRFESLVDDIRVTDGALTAIHVRSRQEASCTGWMGCGPVVLAVGHSARDTIRMLVTRGVRVEPKPFQIGVRIEHPQEMVDSWQYGTLAGHGRLSPAEYWLVAKGAGGDHGNMFSFCMCPGGRILPTNHAPGLIATNGASLARRSHPFANSGLVITLNPNAIGLSPQQALDYQERWEKQAYAVTGESYRVPCQRANDYLVRRASEGDIATSYPLGGCWTEIRSIIPTSVAEALDRGLPALDRKFPGFAGRAALITGPETRASSPIRLLRNTETREAVDVADLYPTGEGAGYAGGIISAAVDGIRTADAIITRYAPPA